MNLYETLNDCVSNMKASVDFSDYATNQSMSDLLSCIIDNPSQIINSPYEETLSLALSSIMCCSFPANNPVIKNIKVRYLVFACGYYLFMHQLETGRFYDKNWPAFIYLLHFGRKELSEFVVEMNPFAPELIHEIVGVDVDGTSSNKVAKGIELNMMAVAQRKGYLTNDLLEWYNELVSDKYELLKDDPFVKEALPLYRVITNYINANDISFADLK